MDRIGRGNYSISNPDILVFPVDSDPYGVTYQEWTVRWWRWITSIPKICNPALDLSGKDVNEKQDDKVLFLCQTLESTLDVITRRCRIRKVEAIFLPIINWISLMDVDGISDEELVAMARSKIDAVRDLRFDIDGFELKTDLSKFRVSSPLFYVELPRDNIFDLPPGERRAASDGYWLFFKAQPNTMKFGTLGSCSLGTTRITMNYELEVE